MSLRTMVSRRSRGCPTLGFGIDVLCLCKHSSEVIISVMKTHESMDPGGDDLSGPSVQVGLGQYSNSICGGDLAGAIGGASVGSPSPSKYR